MENLQGGLSCEAKIARGAGTGAVAGLVGGIFTGPAVILTMTGGFFGGMAGGLFSCFWGD